MNPLDRVVAWLSPERAERRLRSRLRVAALTRARAEYDAASQSRRANNWRRSSRDANSELRGKTALLRELSRDLVRNNPYAARAVSAIVSNTVGAGIIPQARGPNKAKADRANALITGYLDTPLIDADGRHDLYGLEALALRSCVESGEVLIRRRRRFAADGLPLPMQLQVLEADYLDSTKDGAFANGNIAVQGVEFDKIGRVVAYWLFDSHPGAFWSLSRESKRVPASEIIHLFRVDRPGQVRGAPWGAPVFVRIKDFAEYEDAQLVRQKIAACFSVFVHDSEAPDLVSGEQNSENEDLIETLEPGIVENLPPGKDISFASPPGVDGYREYSVAQLRAIASGFGVPYEALTGDLSQVNFSSGRMGWLEFQRSIDAWRWLMFIPTVCHRIEAWLLEAAAVAGVDLAGVAFEWTPPRREMIDPTKEIPAMRDAIRARLTSWSESVRQLGFDPDKLRAEIKADDTAFKADQIASESDPAMPLRAGTQDAAQSSEGQGNAPGTPAA